MNSVGAHTKSRNVLHVVDLNIKRGKNVLQQIENVTSVIKLGIMPNVVHQSQKMSEPLKASQINMHLWYMLKM